MANSSQRLRTGEQAHGSGRAVGPAGLPPSRRRGLYGAGICAAISLAALLWIYATETVNPLSALLLVGGVVGFQIALPHVRRRSLAVPVIGNALMVIAYVWSLGEAHQVRVRVDPGRITAQVDGDVMTARIQVHGAYPGLQAPVLTEYRVQATGEAQQRDTTSVLGRIARTFRLADPGSAWTDIRMSAGSSTRTLAPAESSPSGSWARNRRDEWQGEPGSVLYLAPATSRTYTISTSVVRPDGTQRLLLGVDSHGNGYELQVRLDQPDALLLHWHNGRDGTGVAGMGLHHLALVPDLQRLIRAFLTSYLFALVFAAFAIGLYPFLAALVPYGSLRSLDARDASLAGGAVALAVVLGGLGMTGWVSSALLQRVPHVQDSVAYLFQARIFASGALHVPAPPVQIQPFFQEQFVPFYHGTWLSQYTPGHPAVLALGVLLGAPWLVGPMCASLSLGVIYLLGSEVYGPLVGALAALLGLLSPFWLFLGASYMSHPTDLLFVSCCLFCVARLDSAGARHWAASAGFFAGMVVMTRPLTAAGALLPAVLVLVVTSAHVRKGWWAGLLGFAVPCALLLLYNWVQMGDPLHNTYAAWDARDTVGFGRRPGGPFTLADGLWNVALNLDMLSPQLFGWPFGVALALATLPFVAAIPRRWDVVFAVLFVGLSLAHAMYWGAGLMFGPRYLYEGLPALLLLTARGLQELGRVPPRLWRLPARPLATAVLPAFLVAALTLYGIRFYLPAQAALYHDYNYSSDRELQAVRRAHIHHAIVLVVSRPAGFWANYGNVFFANDPHLTGDIIYARDLEGADVVLARYFARRHMYRLDGGRLTRVR